MFPHLLVCIRSSLPVQLYKAFISVKICLSNVLISCIAAEHNLGGILPSMVQVDSNSVQVIWNPALEVSEYAAQFYGYMVKYGTSKGSLAQHQNVTHNASNQNQSVIISDLNTGTYYYFEITPYRAVEQQISLGKPSKIGSIHLEGE